MDVIRKEASIQSTGAVTPKLTLQQRKRVLERSNGDIDDEVVRRAQTVGGCDNLLGTYDKVMVHCVQILRDMAAGSISPIDIAADMLE